MPTINARGTPLCKDLAREFDAIHPFVTECVVLQMLLRKTISQGEAEQEPLREYEDIPLGEKQSRLYDTTITVFSVR
jgi:hypothetical protein